MKTTEEPVIVEQIFDTTIDKIWNAITDVEQMRQWYFDNIPDFKPEIGFETRFTIKSEGRIFPHVWKVMDAIPNKLITYNWHYEGYAGNSFVKFALFEQNSSIMLRLTHEVKEDFSDDIPEFTRESCLKGWTYFIKESLLKFIEKNNM